MTTEHARNVIVGAGSMGLATAYHLAKRGEPTLLLEQFAIGHDRGSSHGAARITRHSYADVRYAQLMPAAYAAWRELEADSGEQLYLRTGGLSLCPPGVDYVAQVARSLEVIGCHHKRMTGEELRSRIPAFSVSDDLDCVFEPDAGLLLAERSLRAMLRVAKEMGGSNLAIREESPVVRIDLDSQKPTVVLADRTITADRLIVTAGPWTGTLVPEYCSHLRPERQQVLYFTPPPGDEYAIGQFPVFIWYGESPEEKYYGMPGIQGAGVKVARHGGDRIEADADHRHVSEEYREEIRGFLRNCLPGLADAPIHKTEICKYTVAPNEDFLIGAHPKRPDVIVASPCSGHGFKFSCLIGRVLADLSTSGMTDIDFCKPT